MKLQMFMLTALVTLSFNLVISKTHAETSAPQNFPPLKAPGTWIDEKGKKHSLSDWNNQSVILTMMYSQCKRTCPNLTIHKLKEIQKALDERKIQAQFIIATLDPENDTPDVLSKFKKRIADLENWHFIQGSQEQTRQLAQSIGLGDYWTMDDHIQHKFRIVYYNAKTQEVRSLDYSQQEVPSLFALTPAQK